MRHNLFALVLVVATGCSAASSAVGGLLSPKPPQVTVNNQVQVAPSPQPVQTVVVHEERKPKKSFMEKVGIVTTSTVAGAALGALAGNALDSTADGALIGAGIGAAAGVAIAK